MRELLFIISDCHSEERLLGAGKAMRPVGHSLHDGETNEVLAVSFVNVRKDSH